MIAINNPKKRGGLPRASDIANAQYFATPFGDVEDSTDLVGFRLRVFRRLPRRPKLRPESGNYGDLLVVNWEVAQLAGREVSGRCGLFRYYVPLRIQLP